MTMQIKSKQMILNLNLDEQSSQEEKLPKDVLEEMPISARFGLKGGAEMKFNTNLIRPGIFCEQTDDYYNTAVVTYPEPSISRGSQKEAIKRPREISQQVEKEDVIQQQSSKIQLLSEVQHENQSFMTNSSKEAVKQQSIKAEQNKSIGVDKYISISNKKPSTLLNIDLDESDSETQGNNQEQSFSKQHQQTLKLLSLKPHERQKIAFQEIALTHDPNQNMRAFTDKHIQLGKILHLSIYRNQSGLNFLWPEYELHYEAGAPMLYCKKMIANTTSNYYITVKKDTNEVFDHFFVSKLRGNYSGNIYQVFSKGSNPKKGEVSKGIRTIQATIKFKPQLLGNEPRQFQVYTLAENVKYYNLQGIKFGEQIGLDQLFKNQKNKGKIFYFHNRKPIYSAAVEGYILNFAGRVQKASVKNFILEDSIAHRQVLMLGKNDENKFRVDVSWPLKPYVAFCICIANFDSKFVTE